MNVGESLTYFAERGDAEAQAILDEFNGPEHRAAQEEIEAAAAWHPDWRQDGHQLICEKGSNIETIERLVTAYRRAKYPRRSKTPYITASIFQLTSLGTPGPVSAGPFFCAVITGFLSPQVPPEANNSTNRKSGQSH